jgi:ketosteroid isomerase-like protein
MIETHKRRIAPRGYCPGDVRPGSGVREAVETNLELMRRVYALWNGAGVEALVEYIFAPDVVFYDVPEVPDTGVFRGPEKVATRLRVIMESIGHMQFEVRSLEGCGDYTLATVELSFKGPRSGLALTGPQFHLCRWADGRLHEVRVYQDVDQARRAYEHLTIQSS